ncbi:hypothetical protein Pan241w_15110 [Gimesia alba]|uniref:Uncharacterized protein n=1 Tax=Gimesia alba TaxID=2527973 RepID=A0A517RC39_9PLAN|nr:hypothetical protein Pan241w_15110 [Gimesia alba]
MLHIIELLDPYVHNIGWREAKILFLGKRITRISKMRSCLCRFSRVYDKNMVIATGRCSLVVLTFP